MTLPQRGRSESGDGLPVVWRYESCLECRMRMPSNQAAEAHYSLTGHPLGWPIRDAMDWPIMGEPAGGADHV